MLLDCHFIFGTNFDAMTEFLPTRDSDDIRSKFYSIVSRKLTLHNKKFPSGHHLKLSDIINNSEFIHKIISPQSNRSKCEKW